MSNDDKLTVLQAQENLIRHIILDRGLPLQNNLGRLPKDPRDIF